MAKTYFSRHAIVPVDQAESGADSTDFMTRAQVANFLRRHVSTVRDWERRGLLRPLMGHGYKRDDVRLFRRSDVNKLAATLAGDRAGADLEGILAAAVFEGIEQGMNLAAMVKQFRKSPAVIRDLVDQYHMGFGHELPEDLADKQLAHERRLERAAGLKRRK